MFITSLVLSDRRSLRRVNICVSKVTKLSFRTGFGEINKLFVKSFLWLIFSVGQRVYCYGAFLLIHVSHSLEESVKFTPYFRIPFKSR